MGNDDQERQASMQGKPDDKTAPRAVNTGGGVYAGGDVNTGGGDFIGRDKTVHGDEVGGDKVMGDISHSTGVAIGTGATANVTIHQTLSEADLADQNNRRTLRRMVKKYWIEDYLEHSLNHEAAIRLNLADRSSLVENRPWKLIAQQPNESPQFLPPGTPILDVFDHMNQRLLILGEPGAGKTTLLLELARALLQRADETLGYPSPVVFNLSSWIQHQPPLTEWLVDELRVRYTIPQRVAHAWVAQDKLLLLLDGLDEVQTAHRAACAQAINQFQEEHLMPLIVCSRMAEYERLPVRLKLQGAVLLQSLTTEQIEAYLNQVGPPLAAVRMTLHQDRELEELAHSPLTLSIIALAYQDVTLAELSLTDATQTRRQHLFNAYIQRMFVRREIASLYSARQTVRWLQWLATGLCQSGQTIFLIERLQPNWLQTSGQKPSRLRFLMLLAGPLYGLIFGLLVGLGVGLLFGLLDGFSGGFRKIKPIEQSSVLRRKLKSSLYALLFWGLLFGLSLGLLVGLSDGLLVGLSGGLSDGLLFGLLFGLFGGLLGGLFGIFREIEPVKQLSWSWQRIKSNLYFGLFVGLSLGLSFGLLFGLFGGLFVGLLFGLSLGLLFGLLFGLIFQPSTGIDIPIMVGTQTPNQGIRLSVRYALVTSLIFGLSLGLLVGLSLGLLVGLRFGLLHGLRFGLLFGLLFGLSGGGDVVMKHCILRLILWWKRSMPWNYARFLDYATALIFLRKVGGGYIFVHRLIMEHFATLDEQAIERITTPSRLP